MLTSTFPRWEGDSEPPFVFELCRRLGADFDILVLAPHAPGAKTRETMSGLTVVRFRYFFEWGELLTNRGGIMANLRRHPLVYLLVPFFMMAQLLAVARLLRKETIDLIHAHWLIPQGLLAVLARALSRSKSDILCTSHGSDISALPGSVFSALQRFTLRHADAITVVSKAMRQLVRDIGALPEKISVLPMGIDARNLFVPDKAACRSRNEILFVGRLVPEKGVELLVRSLPAVIAKSPETILTVIGQGPTEIYLRQLCSELGIAHKVGFEGAVRNELLPDYFRRTALFVLPSHAEGFGLVCAEAMACECAVVAADLPALREMVSDHETGLLFSDNDMLALTKCVLDLLADDELRERLGKAGRARILTHYDWEVIAQRYREILHGMASNKHPSGKAQRPPF
ncbi:MAG: glycosyltransferase [Nitrosomonadales bacterium]|nr:glycosyltransferase [Nitrosomonadales bacterium]